MGQGRKRNGWKLQGTKGMKIDMDENGMDRKERAGKASGWIEKRRKGRKRNFSSLRESADSFYDRRGLEIRRPGYIENAPNTTMNLANRRYLNRVHGTEYRTHTATRTSDA